MRVTERYFGPIRQTQSQFHPCFASINMHFGNRWREPGATLCGQKSPVAIVPTPKFTETRLDVTEIWLRQLELYVVIVGIPNCVAVHRKQAILTNRPLIV